MEKTMESIKQQVEALLEQEPQLLPAAMAERLGVSEFDVVAALPQEMVAVCRLYTSDAADE